MNCIILAAGRNTRLDNGIPKSLLSVQGETLMERHMRLFSAVGVTNFCIVTGYRNEMLEDFFEKNQDRLPPVTLVHNPDFDQANGISLLCAAEWIQRKSEENFFFTMADHFFTEDFLMEAVKGMETLDVLTLLVDRPGKLNAHIDLEDVTKVKVSENKIAEIGKHLAEYDVYDTGLFLANKRMFDHLKNCIDNGGDSISNMVQALASIKKADVYEVSGYFWNDVDTPSDLDATRGR
jgi:choline kinase